MADKIQHIISLDVFEKASQLPAEDQQLLSEAEKISAAAYAPYSKFKVGAALLLDNGKVVSGNNQENAAYPSGLCAERVALFYAGAQYPNMVVKSIAIVCHSNSKDPVTPCGACRQVIAEYEQKQGKKIRIIMAVPGRRVFIANSIESLLPFMFGGKDLQK